MKDSKEFQDCQTYEERWNWIESSRGQIVLQSRPRIRQLYEEGKLKRMLHDPHWVQQLNQWLLVHNQIGSGGFDTHFPRFHPSRPSFHRQSHSHSHHHRPDLPNPPPPPPPFHHHHDHHHQSHPLNPHSPAFAQHSPSFLQHRESILSNNFYSFSQEQKYAMLLHGFIVVPNVIPPAMLAAADTFVQRLFNTRMESRRPFLSEFSSEECLMDLFFKTPVQSMPDSLFYGNQPHYPTNVHQVQIALRPPQASSRQLFRSFFSKPVEEGKRWHIDGLAQHSHSAFSLLIGIALSDQLSENSGNLSVFPGSHHILLPFLQEFVRNGYLPEAPSETAGPNAFETFAQKPSLESSQQLLLKKGDVVLVHQKIAHRGAVNNSNELRKMVYFRVAPHRHQRDHEEHLSNLWINFQGLRDILS